MLVELRVAEQRLRAVWEVLDGASVSTCTSATADMASVWLVNRRCDGAGRPRRPRGDSRQRQLFDSATRRHTPDS